MAAYGPMRSPIAAALPVEPISATEVVGMGLAGSEKILAEYIWLGASGADLRSRTVVLDCLGSAVEELPIAEIESAGLGCEYEGAGEVYLQPKKVFPDPFRGGRHVLVLCDTYVPPMACPPGVDPWVRCTPHLSNHRVACESVMAAAAQEEPLFSLQQEYCLQAEEPHDAGDGSGGFAMGAVPVPPARAMPGRRGTRCGLSAKASARLGLDVAEMHMQACLGAGLAYSGVVPPEPSATPASGTTLGAYRLGPCAGLDAADQLSLSRWLLRRVAEHSSARVSYEMDGARSGMAGAPRCSAQLSTAASRDPCTGLRAVAMMMQGLSASHTGQLSSAGLGSPPGSGVSDASWCNWPASSAGGLLLGGAGAGGLPPAFPHPGGSGGAGGGLASLQQPAPTELNTDCLGMVLNCRGAGVIVPTSTLVNGCGPILDKRPPAASDPYLTTMLLAAGACGLPLPPSTLQGMRLAAALAAAAAARRCSGDASGGGTGSGGGAPGGGETGLHGCSAGSDAAMELSCGSQGSPAGSADSEEALLSALVELDGRTGGCCSVADSLESDCCSSELDSDASSPPSGPAALTGSCTWAAGGGAASVGAGHGDNDMCCDGPAAC